MNDKADGKFIKLFKKCRRPAIGLCIATLIVAVVLATSHDAAPDAVVLVAHPWLERLAWGSDLLIALAAIFALTHTAHQIGELKQANEDRVRQGNARFVLDLDARYESKDLRDARRKVHGLLWEYTDEASKQMPKGNDEARAQYVRGKFSTELARLRAEKIDEYMDLMLFCGFFESVGLMVKRGYVKFEDIDHLFRGAIHIVDTCFCGHIADRQKETGVPAGLYENALLLVERVKSGST
jgi:hypothetical protein